MSATADVTPASRVVDALMTLESGEALFAPGAVTWHSFDEVEASTVPETFDSFRAIRAVVGNFGMYEVRTYPEVDGVSWAQYVLCGTLPDGSTIRAPAALAVHTETNGLVSRIEEYVDSGQLKPLFAALG